ncbi:hypothetical protein Hsw_0015 [Hymenobacter swuensis DY53]|uniref:Uncharacterized protein n=1 Tax=Hymenobacter swuensis DY53 TaxID=1227739 RepID=W8F1B7_9BACT|nr:hypothetical protein Hsw_0015 [Hymenobacter swuensis DY53]
MSRLYTGSSSSGFLTPLDASALFANDFVSVPLHSQYIF